MTEGVKNGMFWGISVLLFSCPFIFHFSDTVQPKTPMISVEKTPLTLNQKGVLVHVAGAVETPGVYTVQPGTKTIELIQALQLLPHAKLDHLNLAKTLKDGQKIVIKQHSLNQKTKININFASQSQLINLPGIGPSTAQKIIQYRQKVGVIQTMNDIEKVIGKSKYKKVKHLIQI